MEEIRTYEPVYPYPGYVTIVLVKEIKEMGIYVSLLEFNSMQAMLMISELSRRRFRSVNRLIKIGKKEIVVIIRINKERGYIDVSKRQVAEGEAYCMEKKWNYGKFVNIINRHVSKIQNLNHEDCRVRWIWPFYRKFKHAICCFKQISKKKCSKILGINFSEAESEKLVNIVKKKIPFTLQRIDAFFELTCFSEKGIHSLIDSIKNSFLLTIEEQFEVQMVVPPMFKVSIKIKSKRKGIKKISEFLKNLAKRIKENKGELCVKNFISH
mmetsp:Transcript_44749/g.91331  ORF Transcript_44749/g.91331 Transcript_44749/m.91331 type:complete len:268 (+) Transcript_44749:3369-4172(+)